MLLAWKKHRMRCINVRCPKRSWVLQDHRIAAKSCLSTTRADKWAPDRSETDERSNWWRRSSTATGTVNDTVLIYGEGMLNADRNRLNKTTALGFDELSLVRLTDRQTN